MNTPGRATGTVVEARAVCGCGNVLFLGLQVDHTRTCLWESPPSYILPNLDYNWLRMISIGWEMPPGLMKHTCSFVCGRALIQRWHPLMDSKSTKTARRWWKCQWWGLAERSRLLKSGVLLKGNIALGVFLLFDLFPGCPVGLSFWRPCPSSVVFCQRLKATEPCPSGPRSLKLWTKKHPFNLKLFLSDAYDHDRNSKWHSHH